MKVLPFKIIFSLFFILLSLYNAPFSYAETMYSQSFEIDAYNINITAGTTTSDSYNLSTSVGQTAAGKFESDGFIVKAGFQYLRSIIPFTFSISDTSINLGSLTPQVPSLHDSKLAVSYGSAGKYMVTASEREPLTSLSRVATIPDTACDGGTNTCNTSTARKWTSITAYGFGYNMSGDDIDSDFRDQTYYRPFPDMSKGASPVTIMSNTNVTEDYEAEPKHVKRSTITFKLNVAPVQAAATYQTIIDFVAVPSY